MFVFVFNSFSNPFSSIILLTYSVQWDWFSFEWHIIQNKIKTKIQLSIEMHDIEEKNQTQKNEIKTERDKKRTPKTNKKRVIKSMTTPIKLHI